jgi:hypothetical protein
MAERRDKLPVTSSSEEVETFLNQVAAMPRAKRSGVCGRLIFALDATASRQPTWDHACRYQGELFRAAEDLGGLEVQLVFYRGFMECRSSSWTSDAAALRKKMTSVACLGGQTQIRKVLKHALKEDAKQALQAVVFVGDCVEENVDDLCTKAGELGLRGVPLFVFHEGNNQLARMTFQQLAKLSGGAYCRLDDASGDQLRQLLSAIAVFAAGGQAALEAHGEDNAEAKRIAAQLRLAHAKPGSS